MKKLGKDTEKGVTTLGVILFLIFAGFIYLGYIYTPVLIKYYEVKSILSKTAHTTMTPDDEKRLEEACEIQLSTLGIEFDKGSCNLQIDRKEKKVTVTFTYNHKVNYAPTVYENKHKIDIEVSSHLPNQ